MDVYALTHHDPSTDAATRPVAFLAVDDDAGVAHVTFDPMAADGPWHHRATLAAEATTARSGKTNGRIDAEAARMILGDVNGVTLAAYKVDAPDMAAHNAAEHLLDELMVAGT